MAVPDLKTKKVTALSDMEYDEVSLVGIAANQHADILLFKSQKKTMCKCGSKAIEKDGYCEGCGGMISKAEETYIDRRSRRGQIALAKYKLAKSNPTAADVHVDTVPGSKKKRKRKDKEPMIEVAVEKHGEHNQKTHGHRGGAGAGGPGKKLHDRYDKTPKTTSGGGPGPKLRASANRRPFTREDSKKLVERSVGTAPRTKDLPRKAGRGETSRIEDAMKRGRAKTTDRELNDVRKLDTADRDTYFGFRGVGMRHANALKEAVKPESHVTLRERVANRQPNAARGSSAGGEKAQSGMKLKGEGFKGNSNGSYSRDTKSENQNVRLYNAQSAKRPTVYRAARRPKSNSSYWGNDASHKDFSNVDDAIKWLNGSV